MVRIRAAGRILLTITAISLGCILVLVAVLLLLSLGTQKAFVDVRGKVLAGSISEKICVSVNGVQQGMFIKSTDTGNPVLLFLHGGTAMPEYFSRTFFREPIAFQIVANQRSSP